MADDLKKKFNQMQEEKHGKKEIQIDEFEWIELNKQLAVDRDTGKKHQVGGSGLQ